MTESRGSRTGCRKDPTLPCREGIFMGDEGIQAVLGGTCTSYATSSLGIWAQSSWVLVSSRSFPTKAWRRKVRKLGKPLITTLNCVSCGHRGFWCWGDAESSLGTQARHWPENHSRAGEFLAMPWPSLVLPCTRTA